MTFKIRLSQGHLKVLESCPRKFEHIYFDRLTLPVTPEQQLKMQWGTQFHLLMQQRELGMPIEPFLEHSPRLKQMVESIIRTTPELFQPHPKSWRESEHLRTLTVGNYLFTAIYDLLILNPKKADIIDWKTYPLPKRQEDLVSDWQTRLYMYILAETSDYLPKQISFTYWFIQSEPQPKSTTFRYNLRQHRQTHKDLVELLDRLTNWLDTYYSQGTAFPQLPNFATLCQQCNFNLRCGRDRTNTDRSLLGTNLATIPEFSFGEGPEVEG
jgi:PD-(D/E)XK nuclease superfamily